MKRPLHRGWRLFGLLWLLAFPSTALGHQLDEYVQATLVSIVPGDIRLEINLTPGIAVADEVIALIDIDHDGVIQPQEANAYGDLLAQDLTVRLDGGETGLKLTACNFPTPAELRTGFGIIQIEYTVDSPVFTAGRHLLALVNRHLPKASVYLFNAAKPQSGSIQIAAQTRNENQSFGEIAFTFDPPSPLPAQSAKPKGIAPLGGVVIAIAVVATTTAAAWARRKGARTS